MSNTQAILTGVEAAAVLVFLTAIASISYLLLSFSQFQPQEWCECMFRSLEAFCLSLLIALWAHGRIE